MKVIGWIVVSILVFGALLALGFGLEWVGIEKDRILKPKRAAMEYDVFVNTPSFVRGKLQELTNRFAEWRTADKQTKKALEFTVRHQMDGLDPKRVEEAGPELYSFYRRCMFGS